VILVVQSYTTGDAARDAELAYCARENAKLFHKVVAVDGTQRRWQFSELFDICHANHRGKLCVVANSDILFDWSLLRAEDVLERSDLLALTRWESDSCPRMIGHIVDEMFFSGSQDAWVFRGGSLPQIDAEISMGEIGCDQALVGWAVEKGVRVSDPALSIKTTHVHASRDRKERPVVFGRYGYPELTTTSLSGNVLCHDWVLSDSNRCEYRNTEICRFS